MIRLSPRPPLFARLGRSVLASALAGVVVALALLSVSPQAHAWLHVDVRAAAAADSAHRGCTGHDHRSEAPDSADHQCAIVLYAQGASLPLAMPAVTAPEVVWCAAQTPAQVELFLRTPRYLRQPERGPPASV